MVSHGETLSVEGVRIGLASAFHATLSKVLNRDAETVCSLSLLPSSTQAKKKSVRQKIKEKQKTTDGGSRESAETVSVPENQEIGEGRKSVSLIDIFLMRGRVLASSNAGYPLRLQPPTTWTI